MNNEFFKDMLDDLVSGQKIPIEAVEEVAPTDAEQVEYDPDSDPELMRESLQHKKMLREAGQKGKFIQEFLETSKDASWEAFQKSGLAKKLGMTEPDYIHWVNVMLNKNGVQPLANNYPMKTGRRSQYDQSGAGVSKKAVGPYEKPDTYEAGAYAKQVAGLTNEFGDASSKGTAEEMFQDVQNVVRNIILRKTDKRHGLIYGDPG